MELGQENDAIMSYESAIDIKPDYGGAHNNLGNRSQANSVNWMTLLSIMRRH